MRQPRGVLALLSLFLGLSPFLAGALCAQGRGGGTASAAVQPGEECPPGMTLTRVGRCTAPEFPPPSIVDYRPESTLVTGEHLVPKAKFPVVDVHGHMAGLAGAGVIDRMIPELDQIGVQLYILADEISGDRLVETLNAIKASKYPDRFRVLTGFNFQNVGPGWADRAVAQLEADIKAGAVGVGEISKSFGLTTQKNGQRLKIDDPELDPIWEAAGRLNVPVFIHTAEPQEFFEPLDMHNERWLELALFADRRNYMPGKPTFEQLMTERDNVFRKHPNTTFIAAHFGWHANDLGRLAKLLDEFPNVNVEMGAVLYDLGRQPRAVKAFFTKYQDRILFGKDAYAPTEYPYYWRVLETDDEYFDYYRNYHAYWKMYGAALPDDVLRKVYYGNALRLFTRLPKTGFPR